MRTTSACRGRLGFALVDACALLAVASVTGCSSPDAPPPSAATGGDRVVDVLVTGSRLAVLGEYAPIAAAPNDPTGTTARSWDYVGDDGATLASGAVPDTGVATSEFAEDGSASPISVAEPWFVFSAKLPGAPGTLTLYQGGEPGAPRGQSAPPALRPRGLATTSQVLASAPVGASQATVAPAVGSAASDALPSGVAPLLAGSVACPFHVLVVGDAFQDMGAFHAAATSIAGFVNSSPQWSPYASALTYYTQDFVSQDTSIFDPGTTTPRNTAFMTQFGGPPGSPNRRMVTISQLPDATAARLTEGVRAVNAAVVVIIVNTPEYGGIKYEFMSGGVSGLLYVTVSLNASSNQIVVHELSHALLNLADEYTYGTCDMSFVEAINTSSRLHALPWQSMVTDAVPTPAGTGGVGAFEGAHYCTQGVYRPANDCLMRTLGVAFCPVCAAQGQAVFSPRLGSGPAPGGADAGSAGCASDAAVQCSGGSSGYTCMGSATPQQSNSSLTCSSGTPTSGGTRYCCRGGGVPLVGSGTSLTRCPSSLRN